MHDDNYDALADEVKAYIKRFVYLDSEAKYNTAVLWIFHTHSRNNEGELTFDSTPRLAILSDEPGSGKTKLLEICESLSAKGQRVVDPSPAGMLSEIASGSTLFIDELDLLLGRNSKQSLRTILNAGYRPGSIIRHQSQSYDTFSPIALAGMGANFCQNDNLRATYTRSVRIWMLGKPPGTKLESYRERIHRNQAHSLRDVIAYWGRMNSSDLAMAWPELPEGIEDRNADIWSPLLAVGESLGPRWTEFAQEACSSMVLSDAPTDVRPLTPTEKLMTNLHGIFKEDEEKISTQELIIRLSHKDTAWSKHQNVQMAAQELASMLSPLGVQPTKVWIGDKGVRGYWISELSERVEKQAKLIPPFHPSTLENEEDPHKLPL